MKIVKQILTYLLAAFIIFGGVNHFLKPEMYFPFFPDFLPHLALTYLSGVAEIVVGVLVFIPQYKHIGTLGILILMVLFLPLHVIDVFSSSPAIGSHQAALVRLPVQFLFIAWAWYIHKR
jgi:uncharacterized membrane protein